MYIKPGFDESTKHHRKHRYKFNFKDSSFPPDSVINGLIIIYLYDRTNKHIYTYTKRIYISTNLHICLTLCYYPLDYSTILVNALFHRFKSTFLSNLCYT